MNQQGLNGKVFADAESAGVPWSTEGVGRVEDMTAEEKAARRERLEPLVMRSFRARLKRASAAAPRYETEMERENRYAVVAREMLALMKGYVATWG